MKALITALIFCSSFSAVSANDIAEPLPIPDSLLLHANSVVITEEISIAITSSDHYKQEVHRVILVLNDLGKEDGYFHESYDKFRKISDISVVVKQNDLLKASYSKKDCRDYALSAEYTLYSDDRALILPVEFTAFPYTVEINYTITCSGFMVLPGWLTQAEHQSVLKAKYEVTLARGISINSRQHGKRIKARRFPDESSNMTFLWEVENLPVLEEELLGPAYSHQVASVFVAAENFSMNNYEGSNQTWNAFGKWYGQLIRDRQQLPDELVSRIHEVCAGATDDQEKVRRLYSFMQANTRYVAVSLGIGGYQPFAASYVCKYGYGDCKALVNYLQAMLQVEHVQAYPVLINTEKNIDTSFVTSQFNHVILLVPFKKDSIWLECTSQEMPFNQLSSATQNHYGLMVSEAGGFIVKTPHQNFRYNRFDNAVSIELNPDGNALVNWDATLTGQDALSYYMALAEMNNDDRARIVRTYLMAKNVNHLQVQLHDFLKDSCKGGWKISCDIPQFAQVTNSRLFINPFLFATWTTKFPNAAPRKNPVILDYPGEKKNEITISIPEGFGVESLPQNLLLENEDLKYEVIIAKEENALRLTYILSLKNAFIPPQKFSDFNAIISQVMNEESKKIVLVKN